MNVSRLFAKWGFSSILDFWFDDEKALSVFSSLSFLSTFVLQAKPSEKKQEATKKVASIFQSFGFIHLSIASN